MSELHKVIHVDIQPDGHIAGNVRNLIEDTLKSFAGHIIDVVMDIRKSKPSERQDGYYFGGVVPEEQKAFKERFGETLSKEAVHKFNGMQFFVTEKLNESTGEVIKLPIRSHTDYSKGEMAAKVEEIRQYFLINLDWYIMTPDEYKSSQLED